MSMKVSNQGIAFLAAHEGVVPAPYLDSVNVWSFGVGHTKGAGAPFPIDMARGMPANLDKALADVFSLFKRDLVKFEGDVNRVLKNQPVPQHEFDAAVSFHFNTGAIGHAGWVKLWLTGKTRDAGLSMVANWRRPQEIIPRREAEAALLEHGTYGNKQAAVWPVSATGRITWSPVRTLTQAQILGYMGSDDAPVQDELEQPDPRRELIAGLRAYLDQIEATL